MGHPLSKTASAVIKSGGSAQNHYAGTFHRLSLGYYGGHPNPTRASRTNTFNGKSPIVTENPVECELRHNPTPSESDDNNILQSPNGFAEYTATTFNRAMYGDFLVTDFNGGIKRVQFTDGSDDPQITSFFDGFGLSPLDLTIASDDSPFVGSVWVADFYTGQVYVYQPITSLEIFANATADDADGDGFPNNVELAAGTRPDSPASRPPDADGDGIADQADDDDDNDGIPDIEDIFALDPDNGTTTPLPLVYEWANGEPGTGLFGMGFTGMMTNGNTDYLEQFSPNNIIAGAAAGRLTVKNVGSSDPIYNPPTLENTFQLGINLTNQPATTFETRIVAPYFDGNIPGGMQQMGFYVGTGTPDNYVKLVVSANNGNGGIELLAKGEGSGISTMFPADLAATDAVDLLLIWDNNTQTFQAGTRTPDQQVIPLGDPFTPPAGLLDQITTNGVVAVGTLSTSVFEAPFSATWERLLVLPEAPTNIAENVPPLFAFEISDLPVNNENQQNANGNQQDIVELVEQVGACGWEPLSPSPVPGYMATSTVFDGKIYSIGGFIGNNVIPTDVVRIYDPQTDTWSLGNPAPVPITHAPQLVIDDKIWLLGGFQGGKWTNSDEVIVYDPQTDTWSSGPALPSPAAAGNATILNNQIHYIGGLLGGFDSADSDRHWVLSLDDIDAGWRNSMPFPSARNHLGIAAHDGLLYALGGSFGHGGTSTDLALAHVFNPQTNIWQQLPPLPIPTSHLEPSVFVEGDDILYFGGRTAIGSRTIRHEVWAFNTRTQTYRQMAPIPMARTGVSITRIGTTYYLFLGGQTYAQPSPYIWQLTTENGTYPEYDPACLSDVITAEDINPNLNTGDGPPAAILRVEPPFRENGHHSTYESGSFILENTSEGGQIMVRMTLDTRPALLPGIVFDENGIAGDLTGKNLTVDNDNGTSFIQHTTEHPFGLGYQSLTLNFLGFEPNQSFAFSIDLDPASIQGTTPPGPNDSGGIDGAEMIGSRVEVEYGDGTVQSGYLFRLDDTVQASIVYLGTDLPDVSAELITGNSPLQTDEAIQTVRIESEPDQPVRLIAAQVEAHTEGADPDAPLIGEYGANKLINMIEIRVTTDANGVALAELPLDATDGLYYIVATDGLYYIVAAAHDDDPNMTGPPSERLIVKRQP